MNALEPAGLPPDAVEVGRFLGAWGIKGWVKILSYSASPEALFSARRWFLLPSVSTAKPSFEGAHRVKVLQAREHADAVVASLDGVSDRDTAQQLKGVRIFVPRSSFPTLEEDEFYWVDLIGLSVFNRDGVALGQVSDLMATGPQHVLVLTYEQQGNTCERLIPFVEAYVDQVDLRARRIMVDWQPGYWD